MENPKVEDGVGGEKNGIATFTIYSILGGIETIIFIILSFC